MNLLYSLPIIAIVLSPLTFLTYRNSRKKTTNVYLFVIGIVLFVTQAFKDWDSLPDLPNYERHFEMLRHIGSFNPFDAKYEPAYSTYVYLFARYTDNVLWLSIITAALTVGAYLYMAKTYSPIPWLTVFLYICLLFPPSLFIYRQSIAILVCIGASWAIIHRKLWLFLAMTTVAGLFHTTAFVFLPAYFVYTISLNKHFAAKFVLAMTVFLVGFKLVIQFAATYVEQYKTHLTSSKQGTTITSMLIMLAVIVLALSSVRLKKLNGFPKLAFIMCCIAFLIDMAGIGLPLVTRLVSYYSAYSIFLLPYSIACQTPSNKLYSVYGVVVCFYVLYMVTISAGYYDYFKLVNPPRFLNN